MIKNLRVENSKYCMNMVVKNQRLKIPANLHILAELSNTLTALCVDV